MKKLRQKTTSIFAMFLALFFVTLSCQCVYASAIKIDVPAEKTAGDMAMHCHGPESNAAKKSASESSDCCGKCQTEAAATLKNSFLPDKNLALETLPTFSLLSQHYSHAPHTQETALSFFDPPLFEAHFTYAFSLRGPPVI